MLFAVLGILNLRRKEKGKESRIEMELKEALRTLIRATGLEAHFVDLYPGAGGLPSGSLVCACEMCLPRWSAMPASEVLPLEDVPDGTTR